MEFFSAYICGAFVEWIACIFYSWTEKFKMSRAVEKTHRTNKAKKFFNKCCFEGKDERNVRVKFGMARKSFLDKSLENSWYEKFFPFD